MDTTQATSSAEGQSNVHAHNRGWNVITGRILAARDRNIPRESAWSQARVLNLTSTPPLQHVMKYVVASVLVLVTLKYQDKTESIFRENPAAAWCFLLATSVYWLVVGVMKQTTNLNSNWFQTLTNAALASGVLSALSLISIFIQYPISLVPLIIWMPFPVVLAWPILKFAYSLLNIGITGVINKLHAVIVWARGCSLTEEASLPV